jgi:hypothetical protein
LIKLLVTFLLIFFISREVTAQTGNIDQLNQLNLEVLDINDTNALIVAAKNGYLNLVEELIKKGADVNHKDQFGYTALVYAAQNQNLDVFNFLLPKSNLVELFELYQNIKLDNSYLGLTQQYQKLIIEYVLKNLSETPEEAHLTSDQYIKIADIKELSLTEKTLEDNQKSKVNIVTQAPPVKRTLMVEKIADLSKRKENLKQQIISFANVQNSNLMQEATSLEQDISATLNQYKKNNQKNIGVPQNLFLVQLENLLSEVMGLKANLTAKKLSLRK